MSGASGEALAFELDASARRAALNVHRSILLQAPAGSGKTTVLTARVLALLAHAEHPEEILAITFTRKAAAQMRWRILEALEAAGAGRTIPGIDREVLAGAWQRDRERGWQLLRNPGRLHVQTIDALNHWLAGQLPIASRSGAVLQITATPGPLYRRAARRALQEALRDEATAAAATLLFERLDNRWPRLEQLLAEMLAQRTHWLPRVLQREESELLDRVGTSLHRVLAAGLAAALGAVPEALWREGEALLEQLGAPAGALNAEPASLPRWRALCRIALTEQGWRTQLTSREGFERTASALKERARRWIQALREQPEAQAMLRAVQRLPDPHLPPEDEHALAALALLLRQAAAELQLEFVASGKVDYAYVAAAARQALHEQGEPSDFALRFGAALRHVLVDEFQDTSLEQSGLLQVLTAGWEHGDGRTLFLVGDPMQSIYQFREAEVGLFLQAREHGIGPVALQPLELRRNFRSRAPLVAWINETCARLFPAQDDARLAAIRYLPSIAASGAAQTGGGVAGAVDGGDDAVVNAADAAVHLHAPVGTDSSVEAARVLAIVRAARARNAAVSIAILVASRDHAAAIVPVLRDAGFALRGVDLERLRDRAVVRDLLALARALLHGADRTAWLALLRAPWCGLPLGVLEAMVGAVGGEDLFTRLEAQAHAPDTAAAGGAQRLEHRARVERLCAALAPALRGADRALPLWRRTLHCWLRLGGAAIYPRERDRLDARQFIDALALHERPEALVGAAMEEITERLFSSAPPEPGAIDIMTIHAAKGLEWDLVILPGLARRTASGTDPLLHWIELPRARAGTDLLLAPIRASDEQPAHSLGSYIKGLRRERGRLERVRLLYVAMTRARTGLHLLGACPQGAPTPGSLLAVLWPALEQQFLAAQRAATGSPSAMPGTAHEQHAPQLRRLPPGWAYPILPQPPAVQRVPIAAQATREALEYRWVGLTARAVGTMVHAELQRLAAVPGESLDRTALAPAARYAAGLRSLGVPAAELPSAVQRVFAALQATLDDPRGRWLLSNADPSSRSEWRLTGMHAGRVRNVIIDRLLVDEQGERWIVDFKTSVHEGGGLDAFIAAEMQRYRPQLERYAALAAPLVGGAIRLALYFPLLGVFRELAP